MLLEYAEGFAQGHSCADRAEARRPPNSGSVQPSKRSTGYRPANLNPPKQPARAGSN